MAGPPEFSECFSGSICPLEPFFRMHTQAGIPAAPYSQQRNRLGFDSFLRLHTEHRVDPWARKRAIRRPLKDTEAGGACSLSQEQQEARNSYFFTESTGKAKSKVLASFVLGVEPPPQRGALGPLRRQRHRSFILPAAPPFTSDVWGLRQSKNESYNTLSSFCDENQPKGLSVPSPFASREGPGCPRGPPWGPQEYLWCSNSPGCRCADCCEVAVEARRQRGQPQRVSKNPYRVLDAPNLPDDFYLNLIDWSLADWVAVGIRGSVLLWNAKTAATEVLFSKTAAPALELQRPSLHLCLLHPSVRCPLPHSFRAPGASPSPPCLASIHVRPVLNAIFIPLVLRLLRLLAPLSLQEVASVSFCRANPQLLFVGFRNGSGELWDVAAKTKLRNLSGHKSRCAVSVWSRQQMLLWTGSRDQTILMRDLRCRDAFSSSFFFHQSELCGLDLSPSEHLLASGGNDNLLCVWDLRQTIHRRLASVEASTVDSLGVGKSWELAPGTDAVVNCMRLPPPRRHPEGALWGLSPGWGLSQGCSPAVGAWQEPRSRFEGLSWEGGVSGGAAAVQGSDAADPTSVTTSTRSSPEGAPREIDSASAASPLSSTFSPGSFVSLSPLPPAPWQHQPRPDAERRMPTVAADLTSAPMAAADAETAFSEAAARPASATAAAAAAAAAAARGRTTKPLLVYSEHKAAIKAVKFCPQIDGLLASGGGTADRYIRLWNAKLGSSRSVCSVDTGCQVCNICFSPHSFSFLSTHGFSLNQVFLWRFSPSLLSTPLPAQTSHKTLEPSLLESLYPDLQAEYANAVDPITKAATLTGHSARVLFLAASPCGCRVVTGAGRGDESLRFWRVFQQPGDSVDEYA
ncbi:wd g-beta repeat-containing protein [Cyclospora cayetanensis]|uniref:Wd g-beta repeat-containing protein n=1 Tax=Cyclospora cayetanensis TaxID=88456 RepID=A0A1D3CSB4_9EIME|nr:wd g-beta repeat-containing protein [Cyclospora cayetanensis]